MLIWAILLEQPLRRNQSKQSNIRVRAPPEAGLDYPLQTTGGSSSIRTEYLLMLQAGASVRELFRSAAARRWHVEPEKVKIVAGRFVRPGSGEALGYGDLVGDARGLNLPKVQPRDASTGSWPAAMRHAWTTR